MTRVIAASAALALVLTACGGDGDSTDTADPGTGDGADGTGDTGDTDTPPDASGDPIEVTLWFARDYVMPDRFAALEEEHNIRVNYDIRPDDNELPTMLEMRDAGERLPDLIEFDSHRTPFGIETGLIQPMNEWVELFEQEEPDVFETVLPSVWSEGTFDGDIYHAAWQSSMDVLYYNIALLEEAGVEAPLETWYDVRDAARAIKEQNPDMPSVFGSGVTSHDLIWYWMVGFGVPFEGDDGNVPVLTSEQGIAWIEWMQSLKEEELINSNYVIGEQDESQGAFIQQNGAILQDGVNAGMDYMAAPGFGFETEWLAMPLPANADDGGEVMSVPRGWSLSSESENPEAAMMALRYLMTPEHAVPRYMQGSSTPRSIAVLDSPEVAEEQPFFSDDIKDVFSEVDFGLPPGVETLSIGDDVLIPLRDELLVQGTDEPAQAIAERYQAILDEFR